MISFSVKRLHELSAEELFEIYRLRISVFVVEQRCAYQEADDYDTEAVHVRLFEDGRLAAYCRVLPPGTVFEEASIGRVIAVERRRGLGSMVVAEGIRTAREYFNAGSITIEAQTYAAGLYEKLGFRKISGEFLEDGIPHVKMRLGGE